MAIYGRRSWRRRFVASLRQHTRWWLLIGIGVLLLAGAGTAAASIALSGRGRVVAPAYNEQPLQVSGERLSGPLMPGGTVDLVFSVRNPNVFPARVDRVSLGSKMSKASPAGCTAKVSGPLTGSGGYTLPAAERVTVPAGGRGTVTAHRALALAASASKACGFTVDILVGGTQLVAPTSGPATPPQTAPSPPSVDPEATITASPAQVPTTALPVTTAPAPDVPAGGTDDGEVLGPPPPATATPEAP